MRIAGEGCGRSGDGGEGGGGDGDCGESGTGKGGCGEVGAGEGGGGKGGKSGDDLVTAVGSNTLRLDDCNGML